MSAVPKPPSPQEPTKNIRQQFADTMLEVGQFDPRLVVMVGDISHFALQPFAEACPGRFFNIGICEPTSVSMAAGLSKVGFHPVFHTIAPFIVERSFEQIKLDFCYHKLGGNLITVGSAFDYSNLGASHHCYGDFALVKTLPNAEILHPGSATEFNVLFRQAYANERLTMFRIPGHPHGEEIAASGVELGKALPIATGTDLTIIATGSQLRSAIDALPALRQLGWDPDILHVHTIRPLDVETIRTSVRKTGHVVTIEEHMESGGLGDDVLRATQDLTNTKYISIAIPDSFVTEYGSYAEHCARLGLTANGIVERVGRDFGRRDQ